MKNSYPKTNDHRLMGHLQKIAGLAYDVDVRMDTVQHMLSAIDASGFDCPVPLADCTVVYETFPVAGEVMFPKAKSHLWQLLESTGSAMLVTDALIQGADSLFVAIGLNQSEVSDYINRIIFRQSKPALFVNTFKGTTAVIFSLNSIRG